MAINSIDKYRCYSRIMVTCFAAILLATGLSGCLPDSDSVREKRLQSFSQGEAASFATALSSYSTQSHGALLRNAAFLNGTLNQGELGRSLDGVLANGYCHEGGGSNTNHMLLAWYTQTDRDGEFTVKGIGKGAGASIVQALSTHAAPQMIGYYGSREVRLRGPRRNGETDLAIPAGCDLDIPAGAPVLVLEHLSPNDQLGLAGGSYEYRTLSCEDSADIGARTERRAVRTQDDGTVMRGTWEIYDDTCDGAVSTRAVSIERSIGNLIGALDLTDAGSLQGALNGLAGLDCVKVKTGEKQTDAEGNEIEEGEEIADTCDTRNIDVTKYKTDNDMERTDVRSREEMSVSCGRGQTGTLPRGRHDASYQGYTGSLNLHSGWSGTATYERFTYNAEQQGGAQTSVDGLQKGLWQGHELLCLRNETMTVDCYDVFPEYRSLQPVKLGGMSVRRTNRISGWASKSPPNPNDPLAGTVGWVQAGASCEWIENGTYGCCGDLGEGWSQTSPGRKERDVKGVSIKSASNSQWRDLGAAQCRQPYDYYWDDCTTTCTGTGEERECTESCVTRHEIRYHHASTDLQMCEGIVPPPPEERQEEEKTTKEAAKDACTTIAVGTPELKTVPWGDGSALMQSGRFSCCESNGMRTIKPGIVTRTVSCDSGTSIQVREWGSSGYNICVSSSGNQQALTSYDCQGSGMALIDQRLASMMDLYHMGLDPNSNALKFDEEYYLAQNPDVAAAIARGDITSAADHFAKYGMQEGRLPNAAMAGMQVDVHDYLRLNPDIRKALADGTLETALQHVLLHGQYEDRGGLSQFPAPIVEFDAEYYLRQNPDVAAALDNHDFASVYQHYVMYGMVEGRAPNPNTATSLLYYGSNLDDIGVGPLGSNSGYDVSFVPLEMIDNYAREMIDMGKFNAQEYLALNPDVAIAVQNDTAAAEEHYLKYGYSEQRATSREVVELLSQFDADAYIQKYPDVLESVAQYHWTPLDHFRLHGIAEGRDPN